MTKELQTQYNELVKVNVGIDKHDIVNIAVAKAEKSIRENIKKSKALIKQFDEQIATLEKENITEGDELVTKTLAKKFDNLKKAFEALNNKPVNLRINTYVLITEKYEPQNNYSIDLMLEKNHSRSKADTRISLIYDTMKPSARQKKICEKIKALKEQRQAAIDEGANWTLKLSDISSLERQIRARMAELEIEKVAGGKAVLSKLMENLENIIGLTGV